jgi:hypothetical protein
MPIVISPDKAQKSSIRELFEIEICSVLYKVADLLIKTLLPNFLKLNLCKSFFS